MKANTSLRHLALTTIAGFATLFLAACGEEEVADVDVDHPTVAEQPADVGESAVEEETGEAVDATGNAVIQEPNEAVDNAETGAVAR